MFHRISLSVHHCSIVRSWSVPPLDKQHYKLAINQAFHSPKAETSLIPIDTETIQYLIQPFILSETDDCFTCWLGSREFEDSRKYQCIHMVSRRIGVNTKRFPCLFLGIYEL